VHGGKLDTEDCIPDEEVADEGVGDFSFKCYQQAEVFKPKVYEDPSASLVE